jgi:tRNA 2-thiouridine synthesizing protein A
MGQGHGEVRGDRLGVGNLGESGADAVRRSNTDEAGEIVVDARGHRCPTPTLRLQKAVRAAAPGTVVRLVADDPLARIDAPHYAREAGLEILSVENSGGCVVVRVRKP